MEDLLCLELTVYTEGDARPVVSGSGDEEATNMCTYQIAIIG